MNKTKIDWCDSTWNPVTGCLHNCDYCYARKIADRFKNPIWNAEIHILPCIHTIGETLKPKYAYPYGFDPTFHKYRLRQPQNTKKSKNIFVCSMADLFGAWVPDEWIREVFDACEKAPQHNYLFLTKNPQRYWEIEFDKWFPDNYNFWFGQTVTTQKDLFCDIFSLNHFLSIEPIFEEINLNEVFDKEENTRYIDCVKWVIVGAETGNRKNKVIPKKEWIMNIADQCIEAEVPLFMKESLRGIMGRDFVQEFPKRIRRLNR